jgi:hypothetical protein
MTKTNKSSKKGGSLDIRRCPKCGGLPSQYTEFWQGSSMTFEASDGMPEREGILEPGVPCCVYATCSRCYDFWRLKEITDINLLRTPCGPKV